MTGWGRGNQGWMQTSGHTPDFPKIYYAICIYLVSPQIFFDFFLVLGVLRLLPSGQKPSSSRFMSHWPLLGVVRMGCERQALLRQVDIALRKTKAQCRRHAPHFLFRFASCTYGGPPVLMPPSRKVIILLDVLLLPVSTIK